LVAVQTEVVRRERLTLLIDHAASGVAITAPSASLRNGTRPVVPKLLAKVLVVNEGAAPATAFYAKGRESSYLHAESQVNSSFTDTATNSPLIDTVTSSLGPVFC